MYDLESPPLESRPHDVEVVREDHALPDETFVSTYVLSMPETYRRIFDEGSQREHAAIAFRRGASASRVEIWREIPERIAAILVVAEDRPGLLSRISAALVAHDLDVVAAQAFGRSRAPAEEGAEAEREAVDLFWIRRLAAEGPRPAPVRPRDVAHFGETLDALVRGQASADGAVRFARAVRSAATSTRVRFERAPDGPSDEQGLTSLLVEAEDRPGLLLVVSRTLFERKVQIVGSHVMTKDGHVLDRFTNAELDGSALSGARQLDVQTAVLAALRAA